MLLKKIKVDMSFSVNKDQWWI